MQGVGDDFKYAVVAGAVTGGGLTVIANAPNPAGMTILKPCFKDEAVSPLGLFLARRRRRCWLSAPSCCSDQKHPHDRVRFG